MIRKLLVGLIFSCSLLVYSGALIGQSAFAIDWAKCKSIPTTQIWFDCCYSKSWSGGYRFVPQGIYQYCKNVAKGVEKACQCQQSTPVLGYGTKTVTDVCSAMGGGSAKFTWQGC